MTSTDSYALTVNWDDTTGDPVQSSTINASGSQLLAGVNVPKPTSSLDYTYDGTPVLMDATATLLDAGTTTATNAISFTEVTAPSPANCGSSTVQCVSYHYDNDGNITQVIDQSSASIRGPSGFSAMRPGCSIAGSPHTCFSQLPTGSLSTRQARSSRIRA